MSAPRILYHYTAQEGLLGIIKSRCLWTTNIFYLNDSTEFNYALELARADLKERFSGQATRNEQKQFYEDALKTLDSLAPIVLEALSLHVGSFSANPDSLSQWRAYTQNGIGFSLGFDEAYLQSLAKRQKYDLVECAYDEIGHKRAISALIDESAESTERELDLFHELLRRSPRLKHPKFEEEKEWRIVSEDMRHGKPKFRAGKSMLIPYSEFKLEGEDGILRIAEICVGPTPHPQLAVASVTQLISDANSDANRIALANNVRISDVPYRSW
jgi:hypothetical protein